MEEPQQFIDPSRPRSHGGHHLRTPSAAEWIVLGGICATAVGATIAVHTAGR